MNKYIKYSLVFGLGLMGLSSCSDDVLDTKPKESYSEELVWSTPATADAFALNVSNQVTAYFTQHLQWEFLTPNGIICSQVPDGWQFSSIGEEKIDSRHDSGFGRFSVLRACNQLIAKAEQAQDLPESKRRELMAEGKFLRGLLFFDMARRMGRFVPITKVLKPEDKEEFKTPITKTVAESYQLVMADLNAACEDMAETSPSGRANKYAAHLVRSRAALQAYAYTGNASYLDLCIESATKVTQRYPLSDNYANIFNEKTLGEREVIWAKYFLKQDASLGSFAAEIIRAVPNIKPDDNVKAISEVSRRLRNASGQTFEGWAAVFPTQDLVDQYLVIDQKDNKAKLWYETSQFTDNVDVMLKPSNITAIGQVDSYTRSDGETRNIPSAQDLKTDGANKEDATLFAAYFAVKAGKTANISELMYQHRDKRMDATILRDGSIFAGETLSMNLDGNMAQGVRDKEDGGWYNTVTGYYWRKTLRNDVSPTFVASTKSDYHFVLARTGEAYMNLAEAQLLKNNVSAAVAALNATRQAHGGLPASTASTAKEAWEDYIRERRVEMAAEIGDIYFSYLRWGKYGGDANYQRENSVGKDQGAVIKDLNRPVYKIQISRDRSKALVGQVTLLRAWDRNFNPRRYLFPIPLAQIETRKLYGIEDGQNPGW